MRYGVSTRSIRPPRVSDLLSLRNAAATLQRQIRKWPDGPQRAAEGKVGAFLRGFQPVDEGCKFKVLERS